VGTGGVGGGQAPSFVIAAANLSVAEGAGQQLVRGFATQIRAGPAGEARQRLSFAVERVETLRGPWGGDGLLVAWNLSTVTGDLRFAVAPFRHGRFRVTVALRDDGGTALDGQDTARAAVELEVAATRGFVAAEAGYEVTVLETRLLVDQVPPNTRPPVTRHAPRHTHRPALCWARAGHALGIALGRHPLLSPPHRRLSPGPPAAAPVPCRLLPRPPQPVLPRRRAPRLP
jgi:hypothetical protein